MDTFSALATTRRRAIFELLAEAGELTAGEICDHFEITPSAISQHLKVLREARLVRMRKDGQQRRYTVETAPMRELVQWARLIEARMDRLDAVIQAEKQKVNSEPNNP